MKAVLVSALAAAVSAEAVRVIARDIIEVRELAPRQSSGVSGLDSSQCVAALSSLMPLATSVPTPPADLESALSTITLTDPCAFPTNLPASVSSEISAYEGSILSWFSANSAAIENALSACPAVTSYLSNAPVCTTGSGLSGGSNSGSSGATATGSGSTTKSTGSSSSSSGSNSTSSGSGSTTSGTGSTVSSAAKGVISAGLAAGAFLVAVLAL